MEPIAKERSMGMKVAVWLCVMFLVTVVIGLFWYWEGENFGDAAVSGTYVLHLKNEASTLVLRPDHSFQQELDSAGTVKSANGTWRVSGEGHIAFSEEFLKISGQGMSPAGQAYGQIRNQFGLVSITLAPNPDGPEFHQKLLR